jgi:2-phospho-L-lactate guanylyltransferase
MNPQVVATVPVKSLYSAKSRLSAVLTAQQRVAITLNMLRRVLRTASRASVASICVISMDQAVRRLAEEEGAFWQADETHNLNDCLRSAFASVQSRGLVPLYLPADLPLLLKEDIDSLILASQQGTKIVLSPDGRWEGTNCILLPSECSFVPSLGPGSFQRHMKLGKSMGLNVSVYHSAGLGIDLDLPEDLGFLEKRSPGLLKELCAPY